MRTVCLGARAENLSFAGQHIRNGNEGSQSCSSSLYSQAQT